LSFSSFFSYLLEPAFRIVMRELLRDA